MKSSFRNRMSQFKYIIFSNTLGHAVCSACKQHILASQKLYDFYGRIRLQS